MGHIIYYLAYKHQPVRFRRGANPGKDTICYKYLSTFTFTLVYRYPISYVIYLFCFQETILQIYPDIFYTFPPICAYIYSIYKEKNENYCITVFFHVECSRRFTCLLHYCNVTSIHDVVHRIHEDIGTMQYNGYCTNTNDYYPSQNSKMFSKAWNYIHLIYIYIIIGFLLC